MKISPAMRRVLRAILAHKQRTGSDLFRVEDLCPEGDHNRCVYLLLRRLVRMGVIEVASPGQGSRRNKP